MAFFCYMLICFFLFDTFKEDVLGEVLAVERNTGRVGRKALDFARRIGKTGRDIILKLTKAVWEHLRCGKLSERYRERIPLFE